MRLLLHVVMLGISVLSVCKLVKERGTYMFN